MGRSVSYRVDPHSEVPPSRQLFASVLDAMARGELQHGDRLPSVRAMAGEALVNPNTVGKAYRDLEHLGVVVGRNGSGVFVTECGPEIARARRRGETLAGLQASVRRALAAGYEADELLEAMAEIIERAVALAMGDGDE